jgi:hypothetical protein
MRYLFSYIKRLCPIWIYIGTSKELAQNRIVPKYPISLVVPQDTKTNGFLTLFRPISTAPTDSRPDSPFGFYMPPTQIISHHSQKPLLRIRLIPRPEKQIAFSFSPSRLTCYSPNNQFWMGKEIRNPLQQRPRLQHESR